MPVGRGALPQPSPTEPARSHPAPNSAANRPPGSSPRWVLGACGQAGAWVSEGALRTISGRFWAEGKSCLSESLSGGGVRQFMATFPSLWPDLWNRLFSCIGRVEINTGSHPRCLRPPRASHPLSSSCFPPLLLHRVGNSLFFCHFLLASVVPHYASPTLW